MNWRGMVIRCGEQLAQTTLPHFLQWCFLKNKPKRVSQIGQLVTSESGCQRGRVISRLLRRREAETSDGRGRGKVRSVVDSRVVLAAACLKSA
ncbi:MAG: hypothetical protein Q9184_000410 [Pyrenodesmia sp. 2 TL-2023]